MFSLRGAVATEAYKRRYGGKSPGPSSSGPRVCPRRLQAAPTWAVPLPFETDPFANERAEIRAGYCLDVLVNVGESLSLVSRLASV